jgi:hypothetical protein
MAAHQPEAQVSTILNHRPRSLRLLLLGCVTNYFKKSFFPLTEMDQTSPFDVDNGRKIAHAERIRRVPNVATTHWRNALPVF